MSLSLKENLSNKENNDLENNLEEDLKNNKDVQEQNSLKEKEENNLKELKDSNEFKESKKLIKEVKPVEERLLAVLLVCFISGFLDSYTYVLFDQIFANTQTGNLIFLAIHLMEGDFLDAMCRVAPIMSFSFAIFITQACIYYFNKKNISDNNNSINIKIVKMVVIINLMLTIIMGLGFLGTNDYFTNPNTQLGRSNLAIISAVCFICGSILSVFKKTGTYVYAPIMFTGNIRALAETFSKFLLYKDKQELKNFAMYLLLIIVFCGGVSIGLLAVKAWAFNSIYCVTVLFVITYFVVSKDS